MKKLLKLGTLYSIIFLNTFGYFLIIPVLIKVISDPSLHVISSSTAKYWGDYLFAVTLAAGPIAGLIFAPFLGKLSDVIGRRSLLIFCTFLVLISFIVPIFALVKGSMLLFIVGNAINGIASNGQAIAQAAISDLSQNSKSKAKRFSIDAFVIAAAMVIGPIIGIYLSDPQLVSWFGNITPFIFAAIITVLSILLLIFILPETYKFAGNKVESAVSQGFASLKKIFAAPPRLKTFFLIYFLGQLAWAQYYQYIELYLMQNLHFSTTEVSWFIGLIGVWLSIGLLAIYPQLLKRFNFNLQLRICLGLSAISMLGLSLVAGKYGQWLFIVPTAIGMAMFFPIMLTIFSEATDEHSQGWIMAVTGALMGLAWLVGSFTPVILSRNYPTMPFLASTAYLVVAFYLCQRKSSD